MSVKINKSLDDGLVLYLPLNEGLGITGYDKSKYGNNGVISGTPVWEEDEDKGECLSFDGVNDKVEVPANSAFDVAEFTIYAEIYVESASKQFEIFSRAAYNYQRFHWGSSSNRLYLVHTYAGTSESYYTNVIDVADILNKWLSVAVTVSASAVKFYLNGVFNSGFSLVNPADVSSGIATIGNYGVTFSEGKIRNTRFYNRALSDAEISALYRLGVTKNLSDGLVLDMPLNEGSGSTAFDKSKYGNKGTITGATWINDEEKGTVLSFDGVDDYAVCPFPSGLTNITFTCWVNLDKNKMKGLYPSLLDLGWGGGVGVKVICYSPYDNVGFRLYDLAGGYSEKTVNTVYPYDDKMHFISCTYDGTTMKIYLDGVLKNEVVWGGNLLYPSSNLEIFRGFSTSSYLIGGKCKDVRVYNRALSTTEIGQLYRLTQKGVE